MYVYDECESVCGGPGDCYVQCTRYNYGRMSSLSHLQ